jgi:hypothetical protein
VCVAQFVAMGVGEGVWPRIWCTLMGLSAYTYWLWHGLPTHHACLDSNMVALAALLGPIAGSLLLGSQGLFQRPVSTLHPVTFNLCANISSSVLILIAAFFRPSVYPSALINNTVGSMSSSTDASSAILTGFVCASLRAFSSVSFLSALFISKSSALRGSAVSHFFAHEASRLFLSLYTIASMLICFVFGIMFDSVILNNVQMLLVASGCLVLLITGILIAIYCEGFQDTHRPSLSRSRKYGRKFRRSSLSDSNSSLLNAHFWDSDHEQSKTDISDMRVEVVQRPFAKFASIVVILLIVISGFAQGSSMVPLLIHMKRRALDVYLFGGFLMFLSLGSLVCSCIVYVLWFYFPLRSYCLYRRDRAVSADVLIEDEENEAFEEEAVFEDHIHLLDFKTSVLNAFSSGLVEGSALICSIFSILNFGFIGGFSLSQLGVLANGLWSVVLFKELQGRKEVGMFILGAIVICISGYGLMWATCD